MHGEFMQSQQRTEYATALKEALIMRRDGTITYDVDEQLGLIAYSIANWAICDALRRNKLWHSTADDTDFRSEVMSEVCRYFDRVSLDRQPKEILVYLKNVGYHAITDYLKRIRCQKRQHEDVDLSSALLTADFYGRRTYERSALDYDQNITNT